MENLTVLEEIFKKEDVTIGQLYKPAMEIHSQDMADWYFAHLVERQMVRYGRTQEEAEAIERQNLGYFAGYYDIETERRVEKLFGACHPIFGSVENGRPTAEQAFNMGQAWAKGDK